VLSSWRDSERPESTRASVKNGTTRETRAEDKRKLEKPQKRITDPYYLTIFFIANKSSSSSIVVQVTLLLRLHLHYTLDIVLMLEAVTASPQGIHSSLHADCL